VTGNEGGLYLAVAGERGGLYSAVTGEKGGLESQSALGAVSSLCNMNSSVAGCVV